MRHQKNVCDRKATERNFKKTCATGKRNGGISCDSDKRRENSVKMRASDEDHCNVKSNYTVLTDRLEHNDTTTRSVINHFFTTTKYRQAAIYMSANEDIADEIYESIRALQSVRSDLDAEYYGGKEI